MKSYLVFSFRDYYPSGGARDLDGVFDTLEEAMASLPTFDWYGQKGNGNSAHIYSIAKGEIVWDSNDIL